MVRKILHIDQDCFYAAVEMREDPSLRGKPVAVGGTSARGVLCTCNYKARSVGVHSAMPVFQALRACPDLVLLHPRMELYASISHQIRAIFARYTDRIEPLSLDEAYLDVSHRSEPAAEIASEIRAAIRKELRLPSSAGIGPNKLLAKIASGWNKPNGQFEVAPTEVEAFLGPLPVRKLWGVGPRAGEVLLTMGCATVADLRRIEFSELTRRFGRFGADLYRMCRGEDDRPVESRRVRKTLSVERTYANDLVGEEEFLERTRLLYDELRADLAGRSLPPLAGLQVKVKFSDFSQTTLSRTGVTPELAAYEAMVLEARGRRDLPVRLLGLGVRFRGPEEAHQLKLPIG